MDAFWGPLMIYGGVLLIGIVVAACGVPLEESNDRDSKQVGQVIITIGGAFAMMGIGGIAIKLLGELIEAIF